MSDLAAIAAEYFGSKPHPQAPTMAVRDVPMAVELANHAKFGAGEGHVSMSEAEAFWKEFQQLEMSPDRFKHILGDAARVSFALHGRPPRMDEIRRFKDAHPKEITDWYHSLPDKHYPDVPAGELLRTLRAAEQHAEQHLGRKPLKLEGARFYSAKASSEHMRQHYQRLGEDAGGVQNPGG